MFKSIFVKQNDKVATATQVIEPVKPADLKGKTMHQIIEEIHETFYTEVDRLLAAANVTRPVETDKQAVLDKAKLLRELGFTQTKEVEAAHAEAQRLETIKAQNSINARLKETIMYFSVKYPQYKFITEDSVRKICTKYGLVYGKVDRYTGTVPMKNIEQMKAFKIDENDACYEKNTNLFFGGDQTSYTSRLEFNKVKEDEINNYKGIAGFLNDPMDTMEARIRRKIHLQSMMIHVKNPWDRDRSTLTKSMLEIAAPLKDFNTQGLEVNNHRLVEKKIEIPDPVVLQPVYHNGQKHYLIVTAWGLEASDELVVNEKMN